MMTRKLFEFSKIATEYANSIPAANVEIRIWKNHYNAKYAELIILHCANRMIEEDSYYGSWMANIIKNEFGL